MPNPVGGRDASGARTPPNDPAGLPWSEHLANSESTFDLSMSAAGPARASMVVQIEGKDFNEDVFGKWLGYAQVGEGNKLLRTLPHRHPIIPWLWGDVVSGVNGLAMRGRRGSAGGTNYVRYAMTIAYAARRYDVLADSAIEKEWQRFVEWQTLPKSKLLTSEREGWVVNDGTATGAGAGRVDNGSAIKVAQGIVDTVTHIKLIWHLVPPPYYRKLNGFMPNISDVIGKINNAAWPDATGFPEKTLLCEPPDIVDEEAPVHPARIWGHDNDRRAPILSRITFNLKYAPNTWNKIMAGDGYYYTVARKIPGGTSSQQPYQLADFHKLFQKVT